MTGLPEISTSRIENSEDKIIRYGVGDSSDELLHC